MGFGNDDYMDNLFDENRRLRAERAQIAEDRDYWRFKAKCRLASFEQSEARVRELEDLPA